MESSRSIFTSTDEIKLPASNTPTSVLQGSNMNPESNEFTPLATAFQTHTTNELINLLGQQEPLLGDTAPSLADVNEMMQNLTINNTPEMAYDARSQQNGNYFAGNSRAESVSSSRSNLWSEFPSSRANDQTLTFDFFAKSLSAANNYVSMLTREQVAVLQTIRPRLLYDLLQDVIRVRLEKRTKRALPSECAFCKNNGENEELYMTHCLKDSRGRVLCPVLRAYHCPRCGATGERAHTIKYCPESDAHRVGLSARRRMSFSSSLYIDGYSGSSDISQSPHPVQAASAPLPSPGHASILSESSIWTNFGTY